MADVEYARRGDVYIVVHQPTAVVVYLPREAVMLMTTPQILRWAGAGRGVTEAQAIGYLTAELLQRHARGELPRIDK